VTSKIPSDAFSVYVAMGPGRSYQAMADKYGVSKRSVTRHAATAEWAARLQKIEEESRVKTDKRAAQTLDDMNERHLRIAKSLQAKALSALKNLPLDTTRDVIRALDLGVKQERLVRGEPTERSATVEEAIKREYERWMGDAEGSGDEEASQ